MEKCKTRQDQFNLTQRALAASFHNEKVMKVRSPLYMSIEPARMLTSIEFAAESKKISQMSKLAETESRLHKFHLEQTKQLKNDRYEK